MFKFTDLMKTLKMNQKRPKKRIAKCSLCPKIVDQKELKSVVVPLRDWKLCKKCYKEFNS